MFSQLSSPASNTDVPYDILREIFITACSVNFDDRQQLLKQATSDPLTLGSVCRTWRNVTTTTPNLWSSIFLIHSPSHPTLKLGLLDLYLTNSKNFPLSIWFDVGGLGPRPQLPFGQVLSAFEKLIRHCERWEHLDIYIIPDQEGEFRKLLGNVKGRIPLLRSLHIRRPTQISNMDMLLSAPRLQTFSTSSTNRYSIDSLKLRWDQLVSLQICVSRKDAVQTFASCQTLEHCHLFNVFQGRGESVDLPSITPIVSPRLTTLKITQTKLVNVTYILDSICCPVLQELCLSTEKWLTIQHSTEFERLELNWSRAERFLKRSGCPLEILDLEVSIFTNPVLSILGDLPKLKRLSLRQDKGDAFFHSLIRKLYIDPGSTTKPETAVLPILRELHYVDCQKEYGDAGRATVLLPMLLKMLQSRSASDLAGLKVFSVAMNFVYNDTGPAEAEVLKGYDELVWQGVQIDIRREDTGIDVLRTSSHN
ncbi:hypothetical protein BDQ17DRAFT_1366368 [Cyathus striatus]|nr:hypothetical protein BDQ17DRAFT_1366368 [Cyathus striatus]